VEVCLFISFHIGINKDFSGKKISSTVSSAKFVNVFTLYRFFCSSKIESFLIYVEGCLKRYKKRFLFYWKRLKMLFFFIYKFIVVEKM
jgi:hypothetical protein